MQIIETKEWGTKKKEFKAYRLQLVSPPTNSRRVISILLPYVLTGKNTIMTKLFHPDGQNSCEQVSEKGWAGESTRVNFSCFDVVHSHKD